MLPYFAINRLVPNLQIHNEILFFSVSSSNSFSKFSMQDFILTALILEGLNRFALIENGI